MRDIFTITRGNPVHKVNIDESLLTETGMPYVTRTTKNNGVEFFVVDNKEFPKHKPNALTVGGEAEKSFYREEKFLTGNNINILRNNSLNKYNALFIKTCLDIELKVKFNYGRGATKERLGVTSILLPHKNEKPDWDFMENYIKNIYVEVERESRRFFK